MLEYLVQSLIWICALLSTFLSSLFNLWKENTFTSFGVILFPPLLSIFQLIQSDLDDDEDERLGTGGGRGTLRFKHKLPVELKGPEGVHVVHGSTGTLLTSDLNSLPEDDQRALGRSLEALNADGGLYSELNARTESAKSTPMHRHKDGEVLSESPLEITELWLAEASLVWAQPWPRACLCACASTPAPRQGWSRLEECVQSRESHLPASALQRNELVIMFEVLKVSELIQATFRKQKNHDQAERLRLCVRGASVRGHHSYLSLKSCLDSFHLHTQKKTPHLNMRQHT